MSHSPSLETLDGDALRDRVDPSHFHRFLEDLPGQAREAWRLGNEHPLPETLRRPSRVLLAGVGGSAIGADVAATLAAGIASTPVSVIRNCLLPPFDIESTLVILCSFSGNTEETLAAFEQVAGNGAQGMAITTGGRLATEAAAREMPVIQYQWPGPPRTGFGYGVLVPLALLRRLGVIELPDAAVEAAFDALERAVEAWGPGAPRNRAQELAGWLHGGVPAIIGADLLEVAARRWAGEISENAKQVAAAYGIPEFDHNQLEAAATLGTEVGPLRFVLLDGDPVHPRNRLRVEQTAEMLATANRDVQVIDTGGSAPLEAIMASSSLGSWSSYYLALLRGIDPARMTMMDQLKQRLAQEQ